VREPGRGGAVTATPRAGEARSRAAALGARLRAPEHALSAWVFGRLLGVVYVAAFLSLLPQVRGLVGRGGILPVARYLPALRSAFGIRAYRLAPTFVWLGQGDRWLVALAASGALAGALLAGDVAPLVAGAWAWAAYLSLTVAGQTFLGYQWDVLLVEAGFAALFLLPLRGAAWGGTLPRPPRLAVWLVWWLLFRLVFESGVVKLASGDPTWRHLTALGYHFHTQPLPNPVSLWADAAPGWVTRPATALALASELLGPLLLLVPGRPRRVGAWSIIGLQLLIMVTGNYGFFNLLTVVLALLLFDDTAWRSIAVRVPPLHGLLERLGPPARHLAGRVRGSVLIVYALVAAVAGTGEVAGACRPGIVPKPIVRLETAIAPFDLVNGYGLFAVMTTTRPEIVLEGRRRGGLWREYVFRDQPGPLGRPPPQVTPHMPRLDWQMWFAALTAERALSVGAPLSARYDPWLLAFVSRLLAGSAPVTALLDRHSPFLATPPDELRARLFEYRFVTPAEHRRTGLWWSRREVGTYLPPVREGSGGLELAGPGETR